MATTKTTGSEATLRDQRECRPDRSEVTGSRRYTKVENELEVEQDLLEGNSWPTHSEDLQSNSDVPGKGRLAVRGGVLRKKGR